MQWEIHVAAREQPESHYTALSSYMQPARMTLQIILLLHSLDVLLSMTTRIPKS